MTERSRLTDRPRLQIALDSFDLPSALGPLQKASANVDVIECGTILILCEGYRAVRVVRALYPDKPVLADVRIAEAGSKIARLAFEAGADLVSCVAGASLTTIRQVCKVAEEFGGEVQVELADEWYDPERARRWREIGVQHVIVKRSRDREAAGDLSWKPEDLARIDELASIGFTVTVTGGVSAQDLPAFAGKPVGIVIAGRAIVEAEDPAAAAAALQQATAAGGPRAGETPRPSGTRPSGRPRPVRETAGMRGTARGRSRWASTRRLCGATSWPHAPTGKPSSPRSPRPGSPSWTCPWTRAPGGRPAWTGTAPAAASSDAPWRRSGRPSADCACPCTARSAPAARTRACASGPGTR